MCLSNDLFSKKWHENTTKMQNWVFKTKKLKQILCPSNVSIREYLNIFSNKKPFLARVDKERNGIDTNMAFLPASD